jgi:plastocyanin
VDDVNFTVGIIVAVGILIAISLTMIAIDPGYLLGHQVKSVKEKPVTCTTDSAPVCGVDGVTYNNTCMMNAAKINLDHQGECVAVKPLQDGWKRMQSSQHQGVGHESHQAVVILPLSDKVYSGTLQYDASEPVQLVTLHGPLVEGEAKGQAIWTPDGVTKYAMTFVDPNSTKGEWKFAGNALLVHTKKTTPFTVDYKADFEEKPLSDKVKTGTIQSVQDPGIGHESHQIAIILPPTSDIYSGILSYSASEPIQLITLRGPIGSDEHPEKTWTSDGKSIFELTFVDPKNSMGSWVFSGNALAVHTKNSTQFTVSYSVSSTTSTKPVETSPTTATPAETSPTTATPLAPMTHIVSIPSGVSSPGCEKTKECYTPNSLEIRVHDTVSWSNNDTAAHTVSSGNPKDGKNDIFDSGLFMTGNTFAHTFDDPGTFPYFCMVHPWMTGEIIVNKINDMIVNKTAAEEPTPSKLPTAPVNETTSSKDTTPSKELPAGPAEVMMTLGASSRGCETNSKCFSPYSIAIASGAHVVWTNTDSASHTVTSGLPAAPNALFDSGLISSNQKWEFAFTSSGEYPYYCTIHPWMIGKVIVS